MAERSRTSPSSSTTAVKPVGATWSTQRPFSIARSRDDATCWVCTIVPVNDEPLVGLSTSRPPSSTPSRTRSGKNTSQEIGHRARGRPDRGCRAGPGRGRSAGPGPGARPRRSARAATAAARTRRTARGGPCRSARSRSPSASTSTAALRNRRAGVALHRADDHRRVEVAGEAADDLRPTGRRRRLRRCRSRPRATRRGRPAAHERGGRDVALERDDHARCPPCRCPARRRPARARPRRGADVVAARCDGRDDQGDEQRARAAPRRDGTRRRTAAASACPPAR